MRFRQVKMRNRAGPSRIIGKFFEFSNDFDGSSIGIFVAADGVRPIALRAAGLNI
jgi:hypothetical protein